MFGSAGSRPARRRRVVPNLFGAGSIIASAGTLVIPDEGDYFHVSGTTTITDIDFAVPQNGRRAILVFDGALTVTHNATTLQSPTGASFTTAAGDYCEVVQDDQDNIKVLWLVRKGGGADGFASGTKSLFQQSSAPIGWTIDTTHNDKALRVVSSSPTSGGTSPFSTVFGLTAVDSHVLTGGEIPDNTLANSSNGTGGTISRAGANHTGSTPSGHVHTIELRVQFVDVVICNKS